MHTNNLIITSLVYLITLTTNYGVNGQQNNTQRPQKGCSGYGFQIWLSCLTDPCLFATCPRFHGIATCRKEISGDCKTCRASFFINDRRVNCQPTNFQCPPGLPLQECANDPCSITECMDDRFKTAECRGYYCGACLAEYFVDGRWQQCPSPDVKIQGDAPLLLPEIRRAMIEFPDSSGRVQSSADITNTCPDGTPEPQCPTDVCARTECPQYSRATCVVNKCQGCKPEFYLRGQLVDCQSTKCRRNVLEMKCADDPCKYATCPLYPSAECRPSNCGYCHPEWFINNTEVNCFSRMPDNYQCPNGLQQQQCPRNTCRFKRCLKNAQTFCRINNCGGCYAEYVNTKGEIVDCVGWWSKYETQKPKELLEVSSASVVPDVRSMVSGSDNTIQNTRSISTSSATQNAGATSSVDSKQKLLDDIFGDLGLGGLGGPMDTGMLPNQLVSNPVGNSLDVVGLNSASNNGGPVANNRGPVETKTVLINANTVEDTLPTNKPVQLVIQRQPVKHVQISSGSDPIPNVQQTSQQVSMNNRQSGTANPTRPTETMPPIVPTRPVETMPPIVPTRSTNNRPVVINQPVDPLKPILVPIDSFNNNRTFIPGIPIHGFTWRRVMRDRD